VRAGFHGWKVDGGRRVVGSIARLRLGGGGGDDGVCGGLVAGGGGGGADGGPVVCAGSADGGGGGGAADCGGERGVVLVGLVDKACDAGWRWRAGVGLPVTGPSSASSLAAPLLDVQPRASSSAMMRPVADVEWVVVRLRFFDFLMVLLSAVR